MSGPLSATPRRRLRAAATLLAILGGVGLLPWMTAQAIVRIPRDASPQVLPSPTEASPEQPPSAAEAGGGPSASPSAAPVAPLRHHGSSAGANRAGISPVRAVELHGDGTAVHAGEVSSEGHAGVSRHATPGGTAPDWRKRLAQLPGEVAGKLFPGGAMIPLDQEISLQESLDRLGYTVNVPTVYQGRPLGQWSDGYRTSTRSDAITAGWFAASGHVELKTLGEQAALAPSTAIGYEGSSGQRVTLLEASGSGYAMWLDPDGGRSASGAPTGSVRFYADVQDAGGAFGSGTYFSTAADNPGGQSHLIVLPAVQGGTWADEGNNTGHWEGGSSSGGYLLCWEDWTDNDYQDDIVRVEGVQPVSR